MLITCKQFLTHGSDSGTMKEQNLYTLSAESSIFTFISWINFWIQRLWT